MQQLTKSCSWLEFQKLNTSYSWFHPSVDYDLRLILCCGWLELQQTYALIYQVNLRTYSAKYNIFMVCFLPPDFSYHWLRLCLLLQEPWSTLKKLEQALRSFKALAATDSSCSGWSELRRLTRDLRLIDYLQKFDPDAPW